MRKMRCLFSAALLAVAAAVAVPAMAANSPAGPPAAWASWWQELSVWMERLLPVGGNVVAASSDPVETTSGDEGPAPTPATDPNGTAVALDGDPGNDTGPGIDPNG